MTRKSTAEAAEKTTPEVQRRKRYQTFKIQLKEAERAVAMVKLSQAAIDLAKAQNELTEKKHAARKLQSELDTITREIMDGRANHLECWEIKDFATNRVRYENAKTGELLEEREMQEWEQRQRDLPWDEDDEDEEEEVDEDGDPDDLTVADDE